MVLHAYSVCLSPTNKNRFSVAAKTTKPTSQLTICAAFNKTALAATTTAIGKASVPEGEGILNIGFLFYGREPPLNQEKRIGSLK